jgi:hypothetical protein
MEQFEIVRLKDLVPAEHSYRKFIEIWSFSYAEQQLKGLEKDKSL